MSIADNCYDRLDVDGPIGVERGHGGDNYRVTNTLDGGTIWVWSGQDNKSASTWFTEACADEPVDPKFGPSGIFGSRKFNDIVGMVHRGGDGYMPVTKHALAAQAAESHIKKICPNLAFMVRKFFDSMEERAI